MKLFTLFLALAFSLNTFAQTPRKMGWKSEPPGAVHASYNALREFKSVKIKAKSDLRPNLPPAWDQQDIGSCTAFGNMAGFVRAYGATTGKAAPDLSFLGLYYDERAKDGNVNADAGSYISSGAWVLAHIGIGSEKTWPYKVAKFQSKPPTSYYKEAVNFQTVQAYQIDSSSQTSRHNGVIAALSNDRVVVFGGYVYGPIQLLNSRDYWEPMPRGRSIGGHCRAIVGHDDTLKHRIGVTTYTGFYIVRNSWGTSWGLNGHSYIPYAYIDSLRYNDDFWTYIATKPSPKSASLNDAAKVLTILAGQ